MEHHLKTHPDAFGAVWSGVKLFEYRVDDRGYALGDTLKLHEYLPTSCQYTGRIITTTVTYLLRGQYGVPEGYVCMSLDVSACRTSLLDVMNQVAAELKAEGVSYDPAAVVRELDSDD